jgi:signal transduction histidine kinase
VRLTYSHPQVILLISDDGRGFDPQESGAVGRRGVGLVSMKERAASVGGTIDIRSRPGKGTVIRVALPAAVEGQQPGMQVASPRG